MPQTQVTVDENELRISGLDLQDSQEWVARGLQGHRLLVQSSSQEIHQNAQSFSYCDIETFVGVLQGLVGQRFTGVIFVDNTQAAKSLYLRQGQLVFARSNLMDDRLGEVIYREGMITLDQMTEAAVQVTRTKKFGKVLIESGQFTTTDLWDALKMQVKSIFQSIFYNQQVFVEIERQADLEFPTSITFDKPFNIMIEEAAASGRMYHAFVHRLAHLRSIDLTEEGGQLHSESTEQGGGTFVDDMLSIVEGAQQLGAIIERSKLVEAYTLATLLNLMNRRLINVELNIEGTAVEAGFEMRDIKSLLDAYHLLLKTSSRAFAEEGQAFPVSDLHRFLYKRFIRYGCPLFLTSDGAIAIESVRNLYSRCKNSPREQDNMLAHLRSLLQFVLQITGDLLPDRGRQVKESFQDMFR